LLLCTAIVWSGATHPQFFHKQALAARLESGFLQPVAGGLDDHDRQAWPLVSWIREATACACHNAS
jgi:hypothetical protein